MSQSTKTTLSCPYNPADNVVSSFPNWTDSSRQVREIHNHKAVRRHCLAGKVCAQESRCYCEVIFTFCPSNQAKETVIAKGVQGHLRVKNELDPLRRFQSRTSCLRPLIDEIEDPPEATTIVLKYLDNDLLQATRKLPLSRREVKHVSRCVSRR
jgi:hypothetical protein